MIRQEEINNAKEAFYRRIIEEGSYYDPRDCFEESAEWADNNPKLHWISVEEDLPCNHKELLLDEHRTKTVLVVLSRNDNSSSRHIDRLGMINKKGSSDVDWYWFNITQYTVTHWMPVPELPKNRR